MGKTKKKKRNRNKAYDIRYDKTKGMRDHFSKGQLLIGLRKLRTQIQVTAKMIRTFQCGKFELFIIEHDVFQEISTIKEKLDQYYSGLSNETPYIIRKAMEQWTYYNTGVNNISCVVIIDGVNLRDIIYYKLNQTKGNDLKVCVVDDWPKKSSIKYTRNMCSAIIESIKTSYSAALTSGRELELLYNKELDFDYVPLQRALALSMGCCGVQQHQSQSKYIYLVPPHAWLWFRMGKDANNILDFIDTGEANTMTHNDVIVIMRPFDKYMLEVYKISRLSCDFENKKAFYFVQFLGKSSDDPYEDKDEDNFVNGVIRLEKKESFIREVINSITKGFVEAEFFFDDTIMRGKCTIINK